MMSLPLSIVVPLYNEEESVNRLIPCILEVAEGLAFPFELILVDDGSTDRTWERIEGWKERAGCLRALKFRRNCGQTSAMAAGFDAARGEIIVTLDGDLQNDPRDIPLLLTRLQEGYDVVSGWRRERQDSFSRVLPSKVANFLISATTGVRLHDYGCSLKAYRAECIKPLQAYGEMHRFFPALARLTGARVAEIPVRHHPRRYGTSKYGFSRIPKVFVDLFSINLIIRFSSTPLKGFVLGAVPFFLGAFFLGGLGGLAHFLQWTPGKALFFTISALLSGMAAVHLIMLGVLAELVVGTSDLTHTRLPAAMKKLFTEERGERRAPVYEVLHSFIAGRKA